MSDEFQEWFVFHNCGEDLALFKREGDLLIVKTTKWSKTRPDTQPYQFVPKGYEALTKEQLETLVTIEETAPYYTRDNPSIEILIPKGFMKNTKTTWRIKSWTDR